MRAKKKAALPGGRKHKIQTQGYPAHRRLSSANFKFSYALRKVPRRPANRIVKPDAMIC